MLPLDFPWEKFKKTFLSCDMWGSYRLLSHGFINHDLLNKPQFMQHTKPKANCCVNLSHNVFLISLLTQKRNWPSG